MPKQNGTEYSLQFSALHGREKEEAISYFEIGYLRVFRYSFHFEEVSYIGYYSRYAKLLILWMYCSEVVFRTYTVPAFAAFAFCYSMQILTSGSAQIYNGIVRYTQLVIVQ